MGLAFRIIPTVLCRGLTAYKGRRFDSTRSVGMAAQSLKTCSARGVDEMMLIDIAASNGGTPIHIPMLAVVTNALFCPLTVGGGIKTAMQAIEVIRAGADKVAIGSEFLARPESVTEIAEAMGNQAVVVILTYYHDDSLRRHGAVHVADLPKLARKAQDCGAGELVLNCIDRDGMMQGYDLDGLQRVCGTVGVPVVAMGGCGVPGHIADAFKAGASGAAAGSMFLFTDWTPRGVAEHIESLGVEVRRS